MKKVFFLLTAIFLLITASCEKEKITLSEFVIGEWDSQEVLLGETPVIFSVEFNSGTYVFSIRNGNTAVSLDPAAYIVNDELNQITIIKPNFEGGESGDPIMIRFFVDWNPDGDVMTWTPDRSNPNAPILVWTKK